MKQKGDSQRDIRGGVLGGNWGWSFVMVKDINMVICMGGILEDFLKDSLMFFPSK